MPSTLRGAVSIRPTTPPLTRRPQVPTAAMLNLIGAPDAHGTPVYEGIKEALALPNVHAHLYGKSTVKPHRKMGHVTVTGPDVPSVQRDVLKLRGSLRVSGTQSA